MGIRSKIKCNYSGYQIRGTVQIPLTHSGLIMMDPIEDYQFAGFLKRSLAALIDNLCGWIIFFPVTVPMMRWSFNNRSIMLDLIFTIIWTGIFLYLVVHYGATPGKFVLKLRIVDRKCNFLTWPAAIKRKSPYISISLVSLLQMNSAVRTYPGFETVPTFVEIGGVLSQYGGVYAPLALVLSCFIYFDIGVIDYIGGSYVITKSSFITVNNKLKATKTFNMDGLRK